MKKSNATVLIIVKDGKVLLGMKKRGFGEGKWNGFGGKVKNGESIQDAAIREITEECGIIPKKIKEVGILEFEFPHKRQWDQTVHFFKSDDFEGKICESEEMKPQWFDFEKIPYDSMWPDDRFWMPILLRGGAILRGVFLLMKRVLFLGIILKKSL